MNGLLLFIATGLSFLAGVFFGNRSKNHPEFFWTYLIVGLIYTSPLMAGGYTWYDECYAVGFILANLSKGMKVSIKASYMIFILFCVYMLFQSFRGIAFFMNYGVVDALKKSRWILFFIIIVWIFIKGASSSIAGVFDKDFAYRLTKAGLIFNLIYLAFGLIAIGVTGSTAFTQNAMISEEYRAGTSPLLALFGSTGYVVAVYIVFVPAALITIVKDTAARSNVGWITLGLSLVTQVLYNSRSGILIILFMFGLFFLQYGKRFRVMKGVTIFVPFICLMLVFQTFVNEVSVENFVDDMLNTLYMTDAAEQNNVTNLQDIDRRVWNTSAVIALSGNMFNFFFGWGLRTSGFIVAPYVYDLFSEARGSAVYTDDVGTPGFASMAIDSGVIGLFLIVIILIFCLMELSKISGKGKLFLLFAPAAFILQLFVINIFDVLLFYLAIMPCGLYVSLAKCNSGCSSSVFTNNNYARASTETQI